MTASPAHIAAFKSKTLAMIDTLHLEPGDVVGLGLTLAYSHAATSGISNDDLRRALELVIDRGAEAKKMVAVQ